MKNIFFCCAFGNGTFYWSLLFFSSLLGSWGASKINPLGGCLVPVFENSYWKRFLRTRKKSFCYFLKIVLFYLKLCLLYFLNFLEQKNIGNQTCFHVFLFLRIETVFQNRNQTTPRIPFGAELQNDNCLTIISTR